MAKFLSQVYTSIRGKVGGIVYTKNSFAGLVARAFTAPSNPNTNPQQIIRSSFASASDQWTQMSPADRALWEDYAATLVYKGPHGDYTMPGRQVFIGNYALAEYMQNVGGSDIEAHTDPPVIAGFFTPGSINLVPNSAAGTTGFDISIGVPAGETATALIQRSVAWELTKNTYSGPWMFEESFAISLEAGVTTLVQVETDEETAGRVIFARVRLIVEADPHRISNDYILRAIPNTVAV